MRTINLTFINPVDGVHNYINLDLDKADFRFGLNPDMSVFIEMAGLREGRCTLLNSLEHISLLIEKYTVKRRYEILDCNGVEMPRYTDEPYKFVDALKKKGSLDKSGEFGPYSLKEIIIKPEL